MKVLYVEDDPLNRRVLRDMLAVAGVEMDEAKDGRTGLQMLGDCEYAMLLVDLRMPGMDGMTVVRQVRRRGDAKALLPIIVVTAELSLDLRGRCLAAGADEVLFKPVAMDALFEAMGRLLATSGGRHTVIN